MPFLGLKYGQDLENRVEHPHQQFPGVTPHYSPSFLKKSIRCWQSCAWQHKQWQPEKPHVSYLEKPWLVTRSSCNIRSSWIRDGSCSHCVGGKRLGINRANKTGLRDENSESKTKQKKFWFLSFKGRKWIHVSCNGAWLCQWVDERGNSCNTKTCNFELHFWICDGILGCDHSTEASSEVLLYGTTSLQFVRNWSLVISWRFLLSTFQAKWFDIYLVVGATCHSLITCQFYEYSTGTILGTTVHLWVEFVVGAQSCTRVFLFVLSFPSLRKTNISKNSNFIGTSRQWMHVAYFI